MLKGLRTRASLLAIVGAIANAACSQANVVNNLNSKLVVQVGGFANQSGQVCASLFASSQGFPNNRQKVVQRQCTKIANPTTITFKNLKAGSYAVAVIHDRNSDGTLNRNDLGMPVEGYGFSQNPQTETAPPKFKDAVVFVAGVSTIVQVQLRYLTR
ncbi:DUF2141 domain-containing protein [Aliterella atlantica]|uniref:DUF2141 domain-containing protein n=1 Tax=Aliterella atlantica CENA595 TaxID=1618023 RepID=A0A0D8ZZA6_9CYAN|nr:DUF2141 domain-containing protein [Aliterella atlantica]KJH72556.1 hypothetical protein UH38_05355 [Aliterella atlantica CENA595]